MKTFIALLVIVIVLSIIVIPVYADAPELDWINAMPRQIDDVNFEWVNGLPYINTQGTSSGPASISNAPDSFDFGGVVEGSTYTTNLDYFEVTNNSGFAIDISVSGTDMTGGVTWTLSDTATPGTNTVGFKAGLDGADYTIIVKKTAPFNALVTNLADAASQLWGLKMYVPTVFGDGVAKSGTITLTGAAH